MNIIANIHTDFHEKFGIPRQSGLVPEALGTIIFTPEYRHPKALLGLEQFSHIWVIWQFSQASQEHWTATVKPPRLGGRTHVGVFATRSPFRPNPIGLSCLKLEKIIETQHQGQALLVSGVDLMDGTPIYDIKPYIPYADCHPEASQGYTSQTLRHKLQVIFPPELLSLLPEEKHQAALGILRQDPRPAYGVDPDRIYGVSFAEFNLRFQVSGDVLTVLEVVPWQA